MAKSARSSSPSPSNNSSVSSASLISEARKTSTSGVAKFGKFSIINDYKHVFKRSLNIIYANYVIVIMLILYLSCLTIRQDDEEAELPIELERSQGKKVERRGSMSKLIGVVHSIKFKKLQRSSSQETNTSDTRRLCRFNYIYML